jgi:hypothetical protein
MLLLLAFEHHFSLAIFPQKFVVFYTRMEVKATNSNHSGGQVTGVSGKRTIKACGLNVKWTGRKLL